MKPKTEELLYLLLWACDTLRRPTWRNMTESFEGWAYRNGFHRQLTCLERERFIESQQGTGTDRVHRLTETGFLHALGGRDPLQRWKRAWDGRWRMVIFDVPQRRASDRVRLRRYLHDRGFGYLQNSVWVTPDALQTERSVLAGESVNVESLIFLEAQPCAGESHEEIVLGSWNFEAINERYAIHAEILRQRPRQRLDSPVAAKAFQRWLGCERLAWIEAVSLDPLLPESLHPSGYRGVRAFSRRVEAMSDVGEQIRKARISN